MNERFWGRIDVIGAPTLHYWCHDGTILKSMCGVTSHPTRVTTTEVGRKCKNCQGDERTDIDFKAEAYQHFKEEHETSV